jgi:hypothetical protein
MVYQINQGEIDMRSHYLVRLTQTIVLCAAISATAFAQYGGGGMGSGAGAGGYTPPKGGYSSRAALGIGVGVAAAVAGIVLYVHHRHHGVQPQASLVGCTQSAQNGFTLTSENDHQTYSLVADSADLKADERVELSGQKTKDHSGTRSFHVLNIVEDYGACSQGSVSNALAASR